MATLRDAARRASARGAPQSAATYLRRAVAEPPPGAAEDADVRLELGLALAAYMQPEAFDLLLEAVAAAIPVQRGAIALSGARALGLSGRFDAALKLCRQALEHAEAYPPELRERLEAELACNASLNATTGEETRRYVRERPHRPSALELWRVPAAAETTFENRSAATTMALLRPLLEQGG